MHWPKTTLGCGACCETSCETPERFAYRRWSWPNATAIRHDARYDRALNALGGSERVVVDTSTRIAKEAGRILRSAGMRETIDAIVVATAAVLSPLATVVTGDQHHIEDLACCVTADIGVIQLNELPAS